MAKKFETELVRVVWNNNAGDKITVKPDGDGLDLVEIFDEGDNRITMHPEEARLVADALRACADDIKPLEIGASA